jgi:hypothetical protein
MQFQYHTYTVVHACQRFIEDFQKNPPTDEVDLMDYEMVCRLLETMMLAKIRPSVVLMDDYELSLLNKFMGEE